MTEKLSAFFDAEKIEYRAVLPYAACRETSPAIMEREDFRPQSVVLYLLPYNAGAGENLSRYATSRDYHLAIRAVGDRLIAALCDAFPGAHCRSYGDHSPIDERHAALIAGLGAAGDSGLLINETYGTYVFIGDVVTDVAPEALGSASPRPIATCEHCGACRRACPTGILRGEPIRTAADGTPCFDCLSAITQKKGDLLPDEIDLMRRYHTVWGCDVCQDVCPHNRAAKETPLAFFREDRVTRLTSEALAAMDKDAFSARAFAWRGRKTVERNLSLTEEKSSL